jgi:hypothetical protein
VGVKVTGQAVGEIHGARESLFVRPCSARDDLSQPPRDRGSGRQTVVDNREYVKRQLDALWERGITIDCDASHVISCPEPT